MSIPPKTGPRRPMRRMAMGMNRAILCWRSVAMDSRTAGRWKISEETAAHRNTPYHISGQTHGKARCAGRLANKRKTTDNRQRRESQVDFGLQVIKGRHIFFIALHRSS